jgi:hypothetical protein
MQEGYIWADQLRQTMKKTILAFILAAITIGSFAREPVKDKDESGLITLEGTVSDKLSGESLTGAKVKLEGAEIVRYTDFNGRFTIKNLKPGEYTVLVEYISYDTEKLDKISVEDARGVPLDIRLQPSTVRISANPN